MNPKLYVMIVVFLSLLQLSTSRNNETDVQYIIPISNVSSCPTNHRCMTITQFFNSLVKRSNSSMVLKLYLLPGKHFLEPTANSYYSNPMSKHAHSIQLTGLPSSEENVEIICNRDSTIFFYQVQTLRVEALNFISHEGETCKVEIFGSHICVIIDVVSVNFPIYSVSVSYLRAENLVISYAASRRSMMIIVNCTTVVLTNFTAENNTAIPRTVHIVRIFNSALHIKGFLHAVNNIGLSHGIVCLIYMKNTTTIKNNAYPYLDTSRYSKIT